MSIEEIGLRCEELQGKSAPQITSGISKLYGDNGMAESLVRMCEDLKREYDAKVQEAHCRGIFEGVGYTVAVGLVLGTVGFFVAKAKQAKERRALWDANRQIREEIIGLYEERLQNMKEVCEKARNVEYNRVKCD